MNFFQARDLRQLTYSGQGINVQSGGHKSSGAFRIGEFPHNGQKNGFSFSKLSFWGGPQIFSSMLHSVASIISNSSFTSRSAKSQLLLAVLRVCHEWCPLNITKNGLTKPLLYIQNLFTGNVFNFSIAFSKTNITCIYIYIYT